MVLMHNRRVRCPNCGQRVTHTDDAPGGRFYVHTLGGCDGNKDGRKDPFIVCYVPTAKMPRSQRNKVTEERGGA